MSSQYAYDNPYWPYRPNASVVDLLPRDMLPMIHEHWYKFAPINPLWHSIIGLAMVLFGIISVTGNGMVLYLMSTVKSLRTPSNLLVCNLAASDGLMMLFNATIMAVNSFYQTWVFGPFMCELYGISGSLMGNVSILTLMCISRDRYNVIVKGVSGKPLTVHRALGQIALIWLYAFVWTVAPLFGWSRYVPEGNMTSCTIDFLTKDWRSASYVIVYGSFVYFVPLTVIVHSYYYIVKTVAVHEKQLRIQARKMKVSSLRTNQQQKKTRAEFRLAKIALVTVALWFTAWTPYLIIAWYGILGSGDKLTPLTAIWGSVFAKTSACYNPLVYAISHPRYRAALVKKFPSLACSGVEEADDKSETQSAVTAISAGTSKITPIDGATENTSQGPAHVGGKVAKLLGSGDGNISEDVEASDEANF